jgi:hypothetical protein
METKTKFGMIIAMPVFIVILIASFILSITFSFIALFNDVTGTKLALDHLLNESKKYQKRMKFRKSLSKIDQQTIKK